MCLYSCLYYPAFKAGLFPAALYCHVRPAWPYHIFAHYLRSGTIYEKKKKEESAEHKIVFSLSLQLLSATLLILRIIEQHIIMNLQHKGLHVKYRLVFSAFLRFELPRQLLEKSSNIRFLENPSSGSRVVPYGQTEGQTDMTQLTVAYRNFANGLKQFKKQITSDTSRLAVKSIAGPCA